jgi:hypothetical protein
MKIALSLMALASTLIVSFTAWGGSVISYL